MNRPRAHYLHLGKTGGTAVKAALRPHEAATRYEIHFHPHEVKLRDVPQGEKAFFFLRDPIARFVSGFHSRRRQGMPRHFYPWNRGERRAFARFATPNELAEALSDVRPWRRRAARRAMADIQHVRDPVWSWLGDDDEFASRRGDVLFIGFQESLAADFARLTRLLGLDGDIALPTDPLDAHIAPDDDDRALSPSARRNLEAHYARDIAFYALQRGATPPNDAQEWEPSPPDASSRRSPCSSGSS